MSKVVLCKEDIPTTPLNEKDISRPTVPKLKSIATSVATPNLNGMYNDIIMHKSH